MFSSALAYMSRPYSEEMDMRRSVTYTPYATSQKEKTTQFEEVNLSSKTREDAESGDKYDDD